MNTQHLSKKMVCFSANDQQLSKFEKLWKLKDGISYNCYLLRGEKNLLVDTVEKRFADELLKEINKELQNKPLDYLLINHMEPDHSGTILTLLEKYPKLKLIGNHKTVVFAKGFYDLDEKNFIEVATGGKLDLVDHQLEFIQTPMAHWPESMVALEKNSKTLFSSDIFGGYKTVENQVLAEKRNDLDEFIDQARAYFATVLGGYTRPTLSSLKKLQALKIECIAPAHGLVWQKNHQQIYDLYLRWSQYFTDNEKSPGVTVIIGSMYGHTWIIGELIKQELADAGLRVDLLDVSQTSQTEQLNCVWKNQGLIIGSCTYSDSLFPPVSWLLDALIERKVKNKYLGIFSSHSWTGGAMRYLQKFAKESKLELLEPSFETQFKMRKESQQAAKKLAGAMIKKLN